MKVTTIVTTYNHEKFIAEAINSVLMQKVNFDQEIIIVEDCSTDRTREIVIGLQETYPDKIRLMLADRNRNDNKAFAQAIYDARGQYLALLDGDDYWTSPHKLQRQIEFLERYPECTICFHNALAFYEDKSQPSYYFNHIHQKQFSTLEDLWEGNFIAGCSVMLRRGLFDRFPEWFYPIKWADWALYILTARYGKIGYIGEVMGAYRIHKGGGLVRTQRDSTTRRG